MSKTIGESAEFSTWAKLRVVFDNQGRRMDFNDTGIFSYSAAEGFKSDDDGSGLVRYPRGLNSYFQLATIFAGMREPFPPNAFSLFFMSPLDEKDQQEMVGAGVVTSISFQISQAAFTSAAQILPPGEPVDSITSIEKLLPFNRA